MVAPRRGTTPPGQRGLTTEVHHQGTKNTKATHPDRPQITQTNSDPLHPSFLNRKDRKVRKATHPPNKRGGAETQRRRESYRRLHCTARSRPSGDGRVPLGRDTDPNASVRHGVPTQRPALAKRRPRHFSSSLNGWEGHVLHYNNTEERQNRRANGASAGEKRGDDKRSRSELASFSPATGDSQSPVVLP